MLRRDTVFWICAILVGVVIVPYVIPILDEDQFWWWRWNFFDAPSSLAAAAAVGFGITRIKARAERRFWGFIFLAYGSNLAVQVTQAFLPEASWTTGIRLSTEAGYLIYYLAMFLAVDASRGDVTDPRARRLQRLRALGMGIVLAGFVGYVQAVRSATGPWWTGEGMFVLALFDLAVCTMFLEARRVHEDQRWQRILGGMSAVAVAWFVIDSAEGVLFLERFVELEPHPLWDLLWLAPVVAVVFVARRHLAAPDEVSVAPVRTEGPDISQGLMVAGLLSLPLVHALAYGVGLLNPELRDERVFVVFVFLAVMGFVTLAYLRALEEERAYARTLLEANMIERQATLDRLRDFLADAGHEIRTPISVLLTDVDVTLLEQRTTRDYEAVLGRVRGELTGIVDRTQDLLTLAGDSIGVLDLDYSYIDVQALIDGIVEAYAAAAAQSNIAFSTSVEARLEVLGDMGLVGDALGNLIDNAVKFAPPYSRVRIAASRGQGRIKIRVEDEGPGLSDRHAPRVFERFYRGDFAAGGPPGSGLGLAIVKSVVERHKGSVNVSPNGYGGTTFTIDLPDEASQQTARTAPN